MFHEEGSEHLFQMLLIMVSKMRIEKYWLDLTT